MNEDEPSLKGRVTRQSEEALGRVAQELLESPIVTGALSAAFETRERAMRAQEIAMGALNLPSAGDLERLTRRVRSVSQRLEGIEDGLDRLDERLARSSGTRGLEERLERIETVLERLGAERSAPAPAPSAVTPARAKPATRSVRETTGTASRSTARSTAVTRAKSAAKSTAKGTSAARGGTTRPRKSTSR